MDARQLRYFVRIVDAGSMSRASTDLRVSQSALSLHVANLEHELGVPLLIRSKRGVVPTESGELLVDKARSILGQLDNAVQEIRAHAADPAGNVTLGVPASIAAFFSAPLLMQIKYRYPKISLRVVDGVTKSLLASVQDQRIDLALVDGAEVVPTLGVDRLLSEKVYLVGAGAQRFGSAATVGAAQLATLPLILPSREHGIRLLLEAAAEKLGIDLQVKFQVDALPAIKELVRSEFGYTFLPKMAVAEELKRGDLWAVELAEPSLTRTVVLVRPLKPVTSRASDAVRGIVTDLIAKLVGDGEWPATLLIKPPVDRNVLLGHLDWV